MNNSKPSDPLKRLRPGDKLSGIPADAWNAMADAARSDRAARNSVTAEAGLMFRQTGIVKVKNVSGTLVPRGGVLLLTDSLIDPADNLDGFLAGPTFEGDTPGVADTLICVAIDPIPDGEIGRAVASGVAVAKVNVTSASHDYCRPNGDVDEMVSATAGPCVIIAEGEGYAYVLLDKSSATTVYYPQPVRITSATPDSNGWFPGKVQMLSGTPPAFVDSTSITGTVSVRFPRAEDRPETNFVYLAVSLSGYVQFLVPGLAQLQVTDGTTLKDVNYIGFDSGDFVCTFDTTLGRVSVALAAGLSATVP